MGIHTDERLKTAFKEVAASATLTEVPEPIGSDAGRKQINLFSEVPRAVTLYSDPDTLKTGPANLLTNAVKFTPEGGSIHIPAVEEMHYVRITVSDTDKGMRQICQNGSTTWSAFAKPGGNPGRKQAPA